MKTVIHVTHEAVNKIGGIGAVLQGLLTSRAYAAAVPRDILLGPLFTTDGPAEGRLYGGEVFYSSIDGIVNHPYGARFGEIERYYGVHLVYGRKTFYDPLTGVKSNPEVLLVDVRNSDAGKLGTMKFALYRDFGIESRKFEHIWDFEQYCRIAQPGLDALDAIGACAVAGEPPIILAHEYMGMPTALAAMSLHQGKFRTIFYAHEVATMRRIVENSAGYDTMFYPVLDLALAEGKTVDDVFGPQDDFYKHALVKAARFCDTIFAVGDYVVKELRFLHPAFKNHPMDLVYNGIPAMTLTLAQKRQSRKKLREYCRNILGFMPDFVLTHVTRLVPSKGLWRDIKVAEQLEKRLRKENQTAVLIVLSTETAARRPHEVLAMEAGYRWPVAHREGYPDLTGGEAAYYAGVQEFNARSRNLKMVFINQFGFDRKACGERMPGDMEFMDIRKGTDAEFGQSIYEPFGIAQVEALSFGGVCVFTRLCGCAGFAGKAAGGKAIENILAVDYTDAAQLGLYTIAELLKIDQVQRDEVETKVAAKIAADLYPRLGATDEYLAKMLEQGYDLARQMSWEVVAKDFVLPGMERALLREGRSKVRIRDGLAGGGSVVVEMSPAEPEKVIDRK